jgi:DNA repair protein RecO (recombination protein O)
VASRKASLRLESEALLLRRVEYGEADLVLTLLTPKLGKLSALARGARKSARRFSGALEPLHTLQIELDERPGAELFTLVAATLLVVREPITRSLAAMEAAGKALSWARRAAPPRTPDAETYARITSLLDRLVTSTSSEQAGLYLAETGLALLTTLGWGLELTRCVRCGREARSTQSASVDAARGGLICSSCGGARLRITAAARARLSRAAAGEQGVLSSEDTAYGLALVEAALGAHAGIE